MSGTRRETIRGGRLRCACVHGQLYVQRRGQHKKKQKQNEKEKERRVQARGRSRWADKAPYALIVPLSPRATGISSVARSHDGPMKSTLQHCSSAILSTADNDSRHSVCARHGRHLCHPRGARGTLQEREDMVDYTNAAAKGRAVEQMDENQLHDIHRTEQGKADSQTDVRVWERRPICARPRSCGSDTGLATLRPYDACTGACGKRKNALGFTWA
ncbi:hypothetical protein BJ912DRAFT_995159 [Pholiota molesta]|nr:hypothetical protein BJ912DRAFT_995159 [Pholiota molesta]